jgi:hypothetical protein
MTPTIVISMETIKNFRENIIYTFEDYNISNRIILQALLPYVIPNRHWPNLLAM